MIEAAPNPPTLDALAEDPAAAACLQFAVLVELRRRAAHLVAELDARITLALVPAPPLLSSPPASAEPALTPTAAATLLGVTPLWLRKHATELAPFTYRLNRKTVRYSAVGLRRWLAAQKASRFGTRTVSSPRLP